VNILKSIFVIITGIYFIFTGTQDVLLMITGICILKPRKIKLGAEPEPEFVTRWSRSCTNIGRLHKTYPDLVKKKLAAAGTYCYILLEIDFAFIGICIVRIQTSIY
jgi:hypothetical protein